MSGIVFVCKNFLKILMKMKRGGTGGGKDLDSMTTILPIAGRSGNWADSEEKNTFVNSSCIFHRRNFVFFVAVLFLRVASCASAKVSRKKRQVSPSSGQTMLEPRTCRQDG